MTGLDQIDIQPKDQQIDQQEIEQALKPNGFLTKEENIKNLRNELTWKEKISDLTTSLETTLNATIDEILTKNTWTESEILIINLWNSLLWEKEEEKLKEVQKKMENVIKSMSNTTNEKIAKNKSVSSFYSEQEIKTIQLWANICFGESIQITWKRWIRNNEWWLVYNISKQSSNDQITNIYIFRQELITRGQVIDLKDTKFLLNLPNLNNLLSSIPDKSSQDRVFKEFLDFFLKIRKEWMYFENNIWGENLQSVLVSMINAEKYKSTSVDEYFDDAEVELKNKIVELWYQNMGEYFQKASEENKTNLLKSNEENVNKNQEIINNQRLINEVSNLTDIEKKLLDEKEKLLSEINNLEKLQKKEFNQDRHEKLRKLYFDENNHYRLDIIDKKLREFKLPIIEKKLELYSKIDVDSSYILNLFLELKQILDQKQIKDFFDREDIKSWWFSYQDYKSNLSRLNSSMINDYRVFNPVCNYVSQYNIEWNVEIIELTSEERREIFKNRNISQGRKPEVWPYNIVNDIVKLSRPWLIDIYVLKQHINLPPKKEWRKIVVLPNSVRSENMYQFFVKDQRENETEFQERLDRSKPRFWYVYENEDGSIAIEGQDWNILSAISKEEQEYSQNLLHQTNLNIFDHTMNSVLENFENINKSKGWFGKKMEQYGTWSFFAEVFWKSDTKRWISESEKKEVLDSLEDFFQEIDKLRNDLPKWKDVVDKLRDLQKTNTWLKTEFDSHIDDMVIHFNTMIDLFEKGGIDDFISQIAKIKANDNRWDALKAFWSDNGRKIWMSIAIAVWALATAKFTAWWSLGAWAKAIWAMFLTNTLTVAATWAAWWMIGYRAWQAINSWRHNTFDSRFRDWPLKYSDPTDIKLVLEKKITPMEFASNLVLEFAMGTIMTASFITAGQHLWRYIQSSNSKVLKWFQDKIGRLMLYEKDLPKNVKVGFTKDFSREFAQETIQESIQWTWEQLSHHLWAGIGAWLAVSGLQQEENFIGSLLWWLITIATCMWRWWYSSISRNMSITQKRNNFDRSNGIYKQEQTYDFRKSNSLQDLMKIYQEAKYNVTIDEKTWKLIAQSTMSDPMIKNWQEIRTHIIEISPSFASESIRNLESNLADYDILIDHNSTENKAFYSNPLSLLKLRRDVELSNSWAFTLNPDWTATLSTPNETINIVPSNKAISPQAVKVETKTEIHIDSKKVSELTLEDLQNIGINSWIKILKNSGYTIEWDISSRSIMLDGKEITLNQLEGIIDKAKKEVEVRVNARQSQLEAKANWLSKSSSIDAGKNMREPDPKIRIVNAEKWLLLPEGRHFSEEQSNAVLRAHEVSMPAPGEVGRKEALMTKKRILNGELVKNDKGELVKNPNYQKNQKLFSDVEQTILLREGHCGEIETTTLDVNKNGVFDSRDVGVMWLENSFVVDGKNLLDQIKSPEVKQEMLNIMQENIDNWLLDIENGKAYVEVNGQKVESHLFNETMKHFGKEQAILTRLQVRTENFKNRFGDWQSNPENASKVVDENGEPLMVYHWTSRNFEQFENKDWTWRFKNTWYHFSSDYETILEYSEKWWNAFESTIWLISTELLWTNIINNDNIEIFNKSVNDIIKNWKNSEFYIDWKNPLINFVFNWESMSIRVSEFIEMFNWSLPTEGTAPYINIKIGDNLVPIRISPFVLNGIVLPLFLNIKNPHNLELSQNNTDFLDADYSKIEDAKLNDQSIDWGIVNSSLWKAFYSIFDSKNVKSATENDWYFNDVSPKFRWETKSTVDPETVKLNAALDDWSRLQTAETLLWAEFTWKLINPDGSPTVLWQKILDAHNQDGTIYNLTFSQLKTRVEILSKAGFNMDQIRVLFDYGICGKINKENIINNLQPWVEVSFIIWTWDFSIIEKNENEYIIQHTNSDDWPIHISKTELEGNILANVQFITDINMGNVEIYATWEFVSSLKQNRLSIEELWKINYNDPFCLNQILQSCKNHPKIQTLINENNASEIHNLDELIMNHVMPDNIILYRIQNAEYIWKAKKYWSEYKIWFAVGTETIAKSYIKNKSDILTKTTIGKLREVWNGWMTFDNRRPWSIEYIFTQSESWEYNPDLFVNITPINNSETVKLNATLDDWPRLQTAETLLWSEFTWKLINPDGSPTVLWQKILDAHNNSKGGEVYNVTKEQLMEKVRILHDAGFKTDQIRVLIENGICGQAEATVLDVNKDGVFDSKDVEVISNNEKINTLYTSLNKEIALAAPLIDTMQDMVARNTDMNAVNLTTWVRSQEWFAQLSTESQAMILAGIDAYYASVQTTTTMYQQYVSASDKKQKAKDMFFELFNEGDWSSADITSDIEMTMVNGQLVFDFKDVAYFDEIMGNDHTWGMNIVSDSGVNCLLICSTKPEIKGYMEKIKTHERIHFVNQFIFPDQDQRVNAEWLRNPRVRAKDEILAYLQSGDSIEQIRRDLTNPKGQYVFGLKGEARTKHCAFINSVLDTLSHIWDVNITALALLSINKRSTWLSLTDVEGNLVMDVVKKADVYE